MTGWLGGAYDWVKALHVIAVIFWIAGLFMLPRFLVYQMACAPGSTEDVLWNHRNERILKIIVNPGLVLVWVLGLMVATSYGFAGAGWLHAKIAVVFLLSGYHGWLAGTAKKFARGERPYAEKTLRLLNEVPALATIVIVILAVVKPFQS